MSKLACACGNIIVDQTDNLPYKADFLPDKERDAIFECIVESVKSLNEANRTGNRENWIKENFDVPPYPTDLPDQEMIFDLIHSSLVERTRTMYQCGECGRLLLQEEGTERFISFNPETERSTGILDSKKRE